MLAPVFYSMVPLIAGRSVIGKRAPEHLPQVGQAEQRTMTPSGSSVTTYNERRYGCRLVYLRIRPCWPVRTTCD